MAKRLSLHRGLLLSLMAAEFHLCVLYNRQPYIMSMVGGLTSGFVKHFLLNRLKVKSENFLQNLKTDRFCGTEMRNYYH